MFDYDAIIVGGGRRGLRPASIFAAAATVAVPSETATNLLAVFVATPCSRSPALYTKSLSSVMVAMA